MTTARKHILIVGAGLIGAAIAHRTAPHARVTILDAAPPATGASGASFGWINASFYLNPAHHALRVAAIAAHHRLDADLPTGTRWTGTLWFEETGAGLDAMHDALADLGYPHDVLDAAAFARAEPRAVPPARSLRFPTEGATDPADLTRRLLTQAAARGATLQTGTPVLHVTTQGDRITGVATAQGEQHADHVILATGTATPGLLSPFGIALPLLHRPGLLLCSQPLPPLIRHILVGPAGEVKQDAAGRIWTPSEVSHQSDTSQTVAPLAEAAETARLRLLTLLPGTDLHWTRISLGHRPVPGDGLPAVGQVLPGLTIATMHSGVTLAALIGERVAASVLGQGDDALLAAYHPRRFA